MNQWVGMLVASVVWAGAAQAQDAALLGALDEATSKAEEAAGEVEDAADRLMQAAQEVRDEAAYLIEVPGEAIEEVEGSVVDAAAEIQYWGEDVEAAEDGAEEATAVLEATVAEAEGLLEEAVILEADEAAAEIEDAAEAVVPVEELGEPALPEEIPGEEVAEEAAVEEIPEFMMPPAVVEEETVEEEAAEEEAAEEEAAEAAAPAVLVEVDGVAYTSAEAEAEVEKRMSMFAGQVPPEQLASIKDRMREQIVDDFVNRTLLQAALDQSGIVTDEAAVDEFIDMAREGLPSGFTLEEFLEQRGLSMDEMRRDVRFQLSAKQLLDQQLGEELDVSDEEVQTFFDREKGRMAQPESVHARHILISVEADASDEERAAKRTSIESIREELLAGASFADVAAANSTCPSSSRGGDLGTFVRGQMVPPFEEAAFAQEIGVVGDVVETRFGYHLIEVLERNEASEPSLEESREQIVEVLQNQRRAQAFQDYIQDLRAGANVVFPNP